jgi:hypothetical protein
VSVSRYADVGRATWRTPDGREVPYLRRRLLPATGSIAIAGVHDVRPGERVDTIASTELGDAELSWLLADANPSLRRSELERPGRRLSIPASRA